MSRLSHWFDGPFFPLSPWRVFKKSLMIEGDKIHMPSTLGSDALTSPPHQRARGLWSPCAAPSVRPRPGCSPPPGGGQRLPGRRRPLGTPPLPHPCDLDHQPGQPRRPLHAPLAPVAPAAPTGVPHALGQLAFHPGRVVMHRRGAGRHGRRPRRRRLLVMRDDAPPGRLGRGPPQTGLARPPAREWSGSGRARPA